MIRPLMLAPVLGVLALDVGTLSTQPASAQPSNQVSLVRTPNGGIQPQLVVDRRDAAHLLYFKGEAASGDLFYVRMNRGGQFGTPTQVNAQSGSAIATGTVRGGQLAVGRGDRIHVAWQGSAKATPRTEDGGTPVLYSRLNAAGTAFERERNLVGPAFGLDGDALAADDIGNVYVAWHAGAPGVKDEGERRVWVTRSRNDGQTFESPVAASPISTGACGCCGLRARVDRTGALYVLYRSAAEVVHRDTFLLMSKDKGTTFSATKLQDWNVGACPMSTFALAEGSQSTLAAWETAGQIYWALVRADGSAATVIAAPGTATNRKHPAIARDSNGSTLLAWTEGTGWNRGGGVAWQLFDRDGKPTSESGRQPGVPTWGTVAIAARTSGGFIIVY